MTKCTQWEWTPQMKHQAFLLFVQKKEWKISRTASWEYTILLTDGNTSNMTLKPETSPYGDLVVNLLVEGKYNTGFKIESYDSEKDVVTFSVV